MDNEIKNFNLPLTDKDIKSLKSGDRITLSGYLYTARDAAHAKMLELLNSGRNLPIDLKGQTVYYAGPCPAKPGSVIGSVGPTTSSRMDSYSPQLIEYGLKTMIGKGKRNLKVIDSIKKHRGIYLAVTGGAGALISQCITSSNVVAFEELGTEAVRQLHVKNLPAIVIIDSNGKDLYVEGRKLYEK